MPSLLLVVFLLQLVIHLVNTLGAATVNSLLWALYRRLPTETSRAEAEHAKLQREFLRLRHDLQGTSSQDEFAKWAKIRRQHDKVKEQLEKSKASATQVRSTFDSRVTMVRWAGTTGLRFVLQFWFSREPMFWLPKGWFPSYAEWLLSCPRAPLGSISIQAWGMACAAMIVLATDAITALVGSRVHQPATAVKVSAEKKSA